MSPLGVAKRIGAAAFHYLYLVRVFSSGNGALFVYWLARRDSGSDRACVNFAAVAAFCAIGAAFSLNDATDAREDRINNGTRPVAAGRISPRAAIAVYIILAVVGLLAGIELHSVLGFLTVTAMLATVTVYSLAIKSMWPAKNIFIAATVAMLPILAWSCTPVLWTASRLRILGLLFLWSLEKEVLGDMRDLAGDAVSGLMTLPRRIGQMPTSILAGLINVGLWTVFLTTQSSAGYFQWLVALAAIHTVIVFLCAAARSPIWVKVYLRIQIVFTAAGLVALICLN